MPTNDTIRQAIEAIGKTKVEDYRLRLSEHPDTLRATAPVLVAILESSVVVGTRQQYEKKDKKAVEAQAEFTRIFDRANKLVLLTAILTALVLTVGILSPVLKAFSEGLEKVILMALSIGSVAAGSFASKDLYMVRQGKLLEEWMTSRAAAESKRLEYFAEIIKAEVPQPANAMSVELLKLEYFRRFQLETQLTYFDLRGEDKRLAANKNLKQSGLAVAGAAVVTGCAAISTTADAKFAAIASLGAVFSAISSYAALKEQIYQNQRISERYAVTFDSLEDIYKRMDSLRDAVLQTGREPLLHFMDSVHEILLGEHKQWLGEQEQRSQSLISLDDLLRQAKARKEEQQNAGGENKPLPAPPQNQTPEAEQNAVTQPQGRVQEEQEPQAENQDAGEPDELNSESDETRQTTNAEEQTMGGDGTEPEDLQPVIEAESNDGKEPLDKNEVPALKKDADLFQ